MTSKQTSLPLASGEACIAGALADAECGDLRWVTSRQGGSLAVRLMAYGLRKIFRGSLDAVTVDVESFQTALAQAPQDAPRVLIPIHRSYFDFLAAGYLLYARPDIDIPLPHIAAAEEFGQMPLIGPLLAKCGAFFIKRGKGKEDVELTDQINQLVANRDTFEFFIEGTRSRSRQFLPPKRGLLRCLQGTGQRFAVLPIAITYDRVPEERSFVRELCGHPKEKMTLSKLLNWYWRMRWGELRLGRMHISCGAAITLDADSHIPELAVDINAALQQGTAASDYHLRQFCQQHAAAEVTPAQLRGAIERRGGLVIQSTLSRADDIAVPPCIERSFQYQWMHWFIDEAITAQPQNLALRSFAEQIRYARPDMHGVEKDDSPALSSLRKCLFKPVADNYQFIADFCAQTLPQSLRRQQLIEAAVSRAEQERFAVDVPVIENALTELLQLGLLTKDEGGKLTATDAAALLSFAQQCCWHDA